ncbi:MAG: PD-(D/E)XK nuclease family transposase [Bacteroidaceae bacterium]|nr:PD-(D/E)XK nuclease family transposase [Bacteroidaceae bacterium]
MFNLEETYEYDAVYLVSLLNFTDRNISDDIRIEMRLIDVKATRTFMNEMRMIYVQLPLMKKTEEECDNELDYWIFILNNMETLDKMPFTDKNPAFVDLIDLATYQNMSEDEQVAYYRSLKRMWDYENKLRSEREYARDTGY